MSIKGMFSWVRDNKGAIIGVLSGISGLTAMGVGVHNAIYPKEEGVLGDKGEYMYDYAIFSEKEEPNILYDYQVAEYVADHLRPVDRLNTKKVVSAALSAFAEMQDNAETPGVWKTTPGDWKW